MTGTGNELAVRDSVVITPAERASSATMLARSGSIHSWLVVMKDVTLLAEHICDTAFVPKAMRGNAPAVAAAILTGMELDLPPMTALRHVQVVEGSPGLSAEYKRARVLAAGHKLDITEHTTEACTVTGHRKGHESVTVRFTIQDARRAGLVESKPGHGPRPYVTRPRRMLFARACTEVCDALFTDLTNGLPTAELMGDDGDGDEFGGYNEQPAQPQRARVTADAIRARTQTVTTEVVTPDVPPAQAASAPAAESASPVAGAGGTQRGPQKASTGQVGLIQRQFERLHMGDEEQRDARLRVVSRLAGRLVESSKDLTPDEARKVRDTLESLPDGEWTEDSLLGELAMADDPREGGEQA